MTYDDLFVIFKNNLSAHNRHNNLYIFDFFGRDFPNIFTQKHKIAELADL